MRPTDQMIDMRIAGLVRSDPVGAAAWMLRHRGICPMCGGPVGVAAENSVTGRRIFRCGACQWTGSVSEAAFRGRPDITLRELCGAAIAMRNAAAVTRARRETQPLRRRAFTPSAEESKFRERAEPD